MHTFVFIKIILFPMFIFRFADIRPAGKDLNVAEDSLKMLFEELYNIDNQENRNVINEKIKSLLSCILADHRSFYHPFDSLPSLGKVVSDDNLLRVYTWSMQKSPSEHEYFGFIQAKNADIDSISLIVLNHEQAERGTLEEKIFTSDNWYGALYYQVVSVEAGDKKLYTLIGFDFNTMFTNAKMIDVLRIDNGTAVFGGPYFRIGLETRNRLWFEYSSGVVMFVRYIPELQKIVYDHLSPSLPQFSGQFRFYGPDMTHDALKFENDMWTHRSDIDWKRPGMP